MNPKLPTVLVLMATFNGEKWIHLQLDSIFSQSDVNVLLLISDDVSSDRTLEIISDYKDRGHTIEIAHFPASSGSSGNNFRRLFLVADLSSVDYIALCDQDDVWYPKKLSRAVEMLRLTGANGYSAAVKTFGDGFERRVLGQIPKQTTSDFLFEGAGQGCTFVLPVKDFKLIQDVCSNYSELVCRMHFHDWLIYLIIRGAGGKWAFDESPAMDYRQHSSNEIGGRGGIASIMRRWRLITSGWYRIQVEAAQAIYQAVFPDSKLVFASFQQKQPRFFSSDFSSIFFKALYVFKNSRRRLSDRVVLTFAVIFGYL